MDVKLILKQKTIGHHCIATFEVTMPKFILAEAKTHRILSIEDSEIEFNFDCSINAARELSKNSSSSRAIPFSKMLEMVKKEPSIPIAWQKSHKGMQGNDYFTELKDIESLNRVWLNGRDCAASIAQKLNDEHGENSVTKQICNRMIEPYAMHKVLITGSEWANFFDLRCPRYSLTDGMYEFLNACGVESDDLYLEDNQSTRIFNSFNSLLEFVENLTTETDFQYFKETFSKSYSKMLLSGDNFGSAEIHIMEIAEKMYDLYYNIGSKAYVEGIYNTSNFNSERWYIPYENFVDSALVKESIQNYSKKMYIDSNLPDMFLTLKLKMFSGIAAKTSYTELGDINKTHNSEEESVKYLMQCIEVGQTCMSYKHYSPLEHCIRIMNRKEYSNNTIVEYNSNSQTRHTQYGWSRNIRGGIQLRVFLEKGWKLSV
jgi:hypothetical protein